MNKEVLPGRMINKPLRAKSMYDLNERIRLAEKSGYYLVGKVFETRDGILQAMMKKYVEFGGKK